jgi:hypothetical protein
MPDFVLGTLISSAIDFFFGELSKNIAFSQERRRLWFNDHIEPSYLQIVAIHEDYTKQFTKAAYSLEKGTDLEQVVQILENERINYLLKRQETICNLNALQSYQLAKKRKPRIAVVFYNYVSSVDNYLNAASPLPRSTWYSYFIETFSDLVAHDENPLEHYYSACAQGKDAPQIAREQLLYAVQINMPEAFKKVQENYAELRTQCLSQI